MSTSDAIVLQGATREVRRRPGEPLGLVRLLSGVSLTVARGSLLNLVGPSGSGKSSLIRLINRLDEVTSGQISVLGRPLANWKVRELRQRVGMMFQESSLLGLTVRENLCLPFELVGDPPDDIDSRLDEVLTAVELQADVLGRDETELSVGQKQRVALARVLIGRPEVLLLDEPTAALDPRTAERLLDHLVLISDRMELTIVMVTHRLAEAQRMGGNLAVLIEGRLEAVGPVDRLLAEPPTAAARAFLVGESP